MKPLRSKWSSLHFLLTCVHGVCSSCLLLVGYTINMMSRWTFIACCDYVASAKSCWSLRKIIFGKSISANHLASLERSTLTSSSHGRWESSTLSMACNRLSAFLGWFRMYLKALVTWCMIYQNSEWHCISCGMSRRPNTLHNNASSAVSLQSFHVPCCCWLINTLKLNMSNSITTFESSIQTWTVQHSN